MLTEKRRSYIRSDVPHVCRPKIKDLLFLWVTFKKEKKLTTATEVQRNAIYFGGSQKFKLDFTLRLKKTGKS